jgi:hypothetical protein
MSHPELLILYADLVEVVDKQSALLNLPNEKLFPVDANHRTICKIPSAKSQEYEAVGAWIADLARSVTTNILPNLHTLPCEKSVKKPQPVTDEIGLKVLYDGVELNGADPKSLVEYKH